MIYLEDGSVTPVDKSELPIKLPDKIDLNPPRAILWIIIQTGKKLFIKNLENLLLERLIL